VGVRVCFSDDFFSFHITWYFLKVVVVVVWFVRSHCGVVLEGD
jgi:hypothetical protein